MLNTKVILATQDCVNFWQLQLNILVSPQYIGERVIRASMINQKN
jgi:hypothetical protein